MKIVIIGANGFIGSHLCQKILTHTDWSITALDLKDHHLTEILSHPNFYFLKGDLTRKAEWIQEQIKQCDVVIPLAAIATPATYVQDPLTIFALDFEANLNIIRQCVAFNKRLIFPSTSEVYGMCPDETFDEETSCFVTGPIQKERWIYANSKQLLDRLIYAYGKHHALSYTLFRPFNWYGPRLDDINNPKPGSSRVLTQFIGQMVRGENIILVDGGLQKRSFTHIEDGIDALMKIIENNHQCAHQMIFNLGNPSEHITIKQLGETLLQLMKSYPEHQRNAEKTKFISMSGAEYYGPGYQDIQFRVPSIARAHEKLQWYPTINLKTGLQKTLSVLF